MKFDDYEKELLDLDESGGIDFHVPEVEEIRQLQASARETLNKDKRINIRISTRDLESLQLRANRYGMPYQTLISSILHRYVSKDMNSVLFEDGAPCNQAKSEK